MKIPLEESEELLRDEMNVIAWDGVSGDLLDPDKAKEARQAEM